MSSTQLLLAACLLLGGCGGKSLPTAHPALDAQPQAHHVLKVAVIKQASPADAYKALLANSHISLIDVRQPEEFYAGHAAPAVLHPLPDLATWATSLDKAGSYMLICHSGNRSAKAAAALVNMGFTDITNVAGGTAAWEAAGLPISQ